MQKFLFDFNRDHDVQERFHAELPELLRRYELTGEEHDAITSRDVGLLYVLGANGQLLMHYAALLGMPWPDYIGAMRAGVAKYGPVRAGIYAMTTALDEKVANI